MNKYRFFVVLLLLSNYTSVQAQKIKLGGLDNLAYFVEKVRKHEPVVIAYIGGSITQGTGASKYGNNYFWKSKTALSREIVKRGSKVTTYTAAIGGTGSDYAAYRMGAQLLLHKPDLLIIEFAVNDGRDPNAAENMECLIRQALRTNQRMGIVLFYTTTAKFDQEYYAKGLLPQAVLLHHKVAQHYNLTEILTGNLVNKGIKDGNFTAKTFFRDGVHPTDIGHAMYADTLVNALMPMFELSSPNTKLEMPVLLGKGRLEYARLDPAVPLGNYTGWVKRNKQWNWYGVSIWSCVTPGKTLIFPAKGKAIQIIFMGKLNIKWTSGGKKYTKNLIGRPNLPMPSKWAFPKNASPDGSNIKIEAIPNASGKVLGEVWGLFSIQPPREK
jgi:lysophospholipase L1-like esterase